MFRIAATIAVCLMLFLVPISDAQAGGGCQFNSFSQFQQFPQMQVFSAQAQVPFYAPQQQVLFQAQAPQVFFRAQAQVQQPVIRQQIIRQNFIQQRRPVVIRERRGLFGLRRTTTIIR